jgi:hypothetical protein
LPGRFDVARDREDLGAAVVGPAEARNAVAAVQDDPRHRREGLGVVDRGGLAVQAEARGERRLEARLALLALEGLQQRRLLAADVGAEAVVGVQLEVEVAAEDVRPRNPPPARLFERLLEDLVDVPRSRRGCSCSPRWSRWRSRR